MDSIAAELRQQVIAKLQELGFILGSDGKPYVLAADKDSLRNLHKPACQLELIQCQEWLRKKLPCYLSFFGDGKDVIPERICPKLVEVTEDWQHDLFRIARLIWSIPFSKGYGRRLRFLVMDDSNGKLIGLLGLQSPPLSFPARDCLFQYPPDRKTELINQTMDVQTLGAVPPYDRLLGGKLVAFAAASNEVREAYRRKYSGRTTRMEKRVLPDHLVALTTTSAFGRSSIYNRLRYKNGTLIAKSVGYTEGYGSFHLMELYPMFRKFLETKGISTRGGFGTGPRRKWQTMVRALERLGFSRELLHHGVKREVFLFPLINNLKEYMEGRENEPIYRNLPFGDLATWWHLRWLLPRVQRVDGWQEWQKINLIRLLIVTNEDNDTALGKHSGLE